MVTQRLEEHAIPAFLPLIRKVRYWRNRKKKVELPLFSCYVFAKLLPTSQDQLRALRIDGVFSVVGLRGVGTAIPEEQIEAVRRLMEGQLPMCSHPFLQIGQRVRIRSGAMEGVEGVLLSRSGENTLVVSIEAIQRSIAVRIEGYDVEPA
jgi:transcription antitermination factor NusG